MNGEALLFLIVTLALLTGVPILLLPVRRHASARQLGTGMAVAALWLLAFAVRGEGGWWAALGWLIAMAALWAMWQLYLDTTLIRAVHRRRTVRTSTYASASRVMRMPHVHAHAQGHTWCSTGECHPEGQP